MKGETKIGSLGELGPVFDDMSSKLKNGAPKEAKHTSPEEEHGGTKKEKEGQKPSRPSRTTPPENKESTPPAHRNPIGFKQNQKVESEKAIRKNQLRLQVAHVTTEDFFDKIPDQKKKISRYNKRDDLYLSKVTRTRARKGSEPIFDEKETTTKSLKGSHYEQEIAKINEFKERTKTEKPTRKRTTPLEYSESKYITSRDFIDYSKKKEGERTKTTEVAVDNLLRIFPEYQTHLDSKKLADILKEYKERNIPLEKIVIHGQEYIDAETGELKIREQGDIDTDAALEVLKNAGITWKKLDYVKKGEFIPGAFHIDTGGAYAVMLKEEKGADGKIQKTAFVDHHGASKAYPMSATLNMYNMLLEHGLLSLSDKNKYLIDLSRFVTDVDNLSYIKNPNRKYRSIALAEKLKIDPEKNPEGEFPINKNEPLIDENFFKSTWWKTPYGTVKQLPFSFILERTKKGIPPHQPFSKDEMEQKVITANGKEVLLKDLCARIKKNTNLSISLMEKSQEKMEDEYIKPQTKKLGKLVFNQSRIENKGGVQKEQDKMPIMFETARMAGYDSYILWNKDSKRIFISSVHDLENTYRSVKKIFPDSKLIRGVMIVAPLDPKWTEKYKDVTLADVKNALELNESKEEALARLQEEEAILNKTLENLKSQK